ncbi:MAG: T9SS type A sorting domain-containing protein [Candidatus Marinimicrobia bacterium]|nr:T9SS type A sorting domain-containing protein [Candidatus Neomarinimicrobiota bacterium]
MLSCKSKSGLWIYCLIFVTVSSGEDDIIFERSISIRAPQYNANRDISDTLAYYPADGNWSGQFIMNPGDAMLMSFKMPSDGVIKGINIPVYEWGTGDQELTVSVHKLQYPYDINDEEYPNLMVGNNGWIGGYDMDSTGTLYISGNVYTPGGTQGICDPSDFLTMNITDPLLVAEPGVGPPDVPPQGVVWPDSDNVVLMTPQTHPDYITSGNLNNWIDLQDFGDEYQFECYEWIGILFQYTGDGGGDNDKVGFFYEEGEGVVNTRPFLKFYDDCGGTSGNGGWHIRHWMIRIEMAVEITSDRPPVFNEVCPLPTTYLTSDRTACIFLLDDNPGGGPAGVDSVFFMYALDSTSGTWNSIEMYLVEGDSIDGQWECTVPGQPTGISVFWYIKFSDVGNSSCYSYFSTISYSYSIFQVEHEMLFISNQNRFGTWITNYYLYGGTYYNSYDIWDINWGIPNASLLSEYKYIIEVTMDDPVDLTVSDSLMTSGFFDDDSSGYVLTGENWIQLPVEYTTYTAGDFEYDILGLAGAESLHNWNNPWASDAKFRFIPIATDPISGDLYYFLGDSLDLNYDPNYELGFSANLKKLYPINENSISMYSITGALDSLDMPTNDDTAAVAIHRELPSGAKVVFLGYDPLSLNTSPLYFWIGISLVGTLTKALDWLHRGSVSIDPAISMPEKFRLHHNYPNPFNPITNIHYELHKNTEVKITIYDVLGRVVRKLVNGKQVSGKHKVMWNGTNDLGQPVSAGVYFYKMEAGDVVKTRKMVLLK